MKFVREYTNKDGKKSWTFIPPKDVRDAGVCDQQTFTDGRAFRYEYPRLLELVTKYRKGEIREGGLSDRSLFVHLRNHYFNSDHFLFRLSISISSSTPNRLGDTRKSFSFQAIPQDSDLLNSTKRNIEPQRYHRMRYYTQKCANSLMVPLDSQPSFLPH